MKKLRKFETLLNLRGWARTIREEQEIFVLIGNRRSCAVELRDVYRERFVIRLGTILQEAERHRFTQQYPPMIGTAEVNAGVDSVSKGNVER